MDALQSKDTFEKKNSLAPTLSLQRFKMLQIKWLELETIAWYIMEQMDIYA